MPSPPDGLPLDNWPTIVVGLIAALAAFLVPFNGFMKTWFEYRLETKKAESMKKEVARDVACGAGNSAVFDTMAISDLATAVKDLASAIRADTASDEAHHVDKMTTVIGRFSDAMDRWEERETQDPRRNNRRSGHHDHR